MDKIVIYFKYLSCKWLLKCVNTATHHKCFKYQQNIMEPYFINKLPKIATVLEGNVISV